MPIPETPMAAGGPSLSASPVVATAGSSEPAAHSVVLLHGRGSSEREIIALADQLPAAAAYAAVRARGFAEGWRLCMVCRPVASATRCGVAGRFHGVVRAWLDLHAAGRPACPARRLQRERGIRWRADTCQIRSALMEQSFCLALCHSMPGSRHTARLTRLPVFVAQGDQDRIRPPELLERTWQYPLADSAPAAYARRDPGGHHISAQTLGELGGWIHERFSFLTRPGVNDRIADSGHWPALPGGHLPLRTGQRPAVSWTIPQEQLSDNAPLDLQERLFSGSAGSPASRPRSPRSPSQAPAA